jgi:Xaa-Pro aminopeptidase
MRNAIGVLLAVALFAPAARSGEFQDDLKARRARMMDRLSGNTLFVLQSAPAKVYSKDIDYEYHQDNNFHYLTGIDQEDSTLVLMPGNLHRKEILFVQPKNPRQEHWTGRVLSKAEASAQSGIETVYLTTDFDHFLETLLAGDTYRVPPKNEYTPDFGPFLKALREGQARLAVVLDPKPKLAAPPPPALEFANRLKERFVGFSVVDAGNIVTDLRQVKTAYERKVLERSVDISNDAQMAGMRAAHPGAYEYEVKAAIEQVYKNNGALGWGYPSITGSGPNATVLHYAKAGRKMDSGELILVDAAANYQYYTGDITRTYPVNGKYSASQRDIYSIVLDAQRQAMQMAKAGTKLRDIHEKTVEVIKAGLLKLGLITDTSGEQYRTWYTHGAVHFIGMDVHDVGNADRPLEPGMAFVIEPGIYIQETALDSLDKTPENNAFIEKVRPAFEKYKNIGIRIEDSFLLTESGLEHLSSRVPRTIEEVESFMGARQAAGGAR